MSKQLNTILGLALIAILTSSCGMPILSKHVERKTHSNRMYSSTNSSFSPYVGQFEQHGKQVTGNPNYTVGDIPINFDIPEDNSFEGVCYIYSNNSREIIIRKDWWDSASDEDKESLIFHELGHCALDRDHDNEMTPDNNKASLMHQVIVRGHIFNAHRAGYVSELFTKDKSSVINSFQNNP